MNIIDAWKTAKEGQNLTRRAVAFRIIKKNDMYFPQTVNDLSSDSALADDWEVVREKKVLNLEWGSMSNTLDAKYVYNNTQKLTQNHDIPKDAKVTIEWEE